VKNPYIDEEDNCYGLEQDDEEYTLTKASLIRDEDGECKLEMSYASSNETIITYLEEDCENFVFLTTTFVCKKR